jgi:hypothetical protein
LGSSEARRRAPGVERQEYLEGGGCPEMALLVEMALRVGEGSPEEGTLGEGRHVEEAVDKAVGLGKEREGAGRMVREADGMTWDTAAVEGRRGILAEGFSVGRKDQRRAEAAPDAPRSSHTEQDEAAGAVVEGVQQNRRAGRLDDRHREGALDDDRRRHYRCAGDRRPTWKRGRDCPSSFR